MNLYGEWLEGGFDSCMSFSDWLELELSNLRKAVKITLEENRHLTDGDDCTLKILKDSIGEGWEDIYTGNDADVKEASDAISKSKATK